MGDSQAQKASEGAVNIQAGGDISFDLSHAGRNHTMDLAPVRRKLGELLIEKISSGIEGIARPFQIRRVAEAEAYAEKIRAVSKIEISELERRALNRLFREEAKRQANIESIAGKAIPLLMDQAQPQNIEDDWIATFFDKCRLISDEEMQALWSKLLAGEANQPGRYSKRTVNMLASMDKSDAEDFKKLGSFVADLNGKVAFVYDHRASIYTDAGVTFEALQHLDSIGLISFEPTVGYVMTALPDPFHVRYCAEEVVIESATKCRLATGHVLLSKTGQQLTGICGSMPNARFVEYLIENWQAQGHQVRRQFDSRATDSVITT